MLNYNSSCLKNLSFLLLLVAGVSGCAIKPIPVSVTPEFIATDMLKNNVKISHYRGLPVESSGFQGKTEEMNKEIGKYISNSLAQHSYLGTNKSQFELKLDVHELNYITPLKHRFHLFAMNPITLEATSATGMINIGYKLVNSENKKLISASTESNQFHVSPPEGRATGSPRRMGLEATWKSTEQVLYQILRKLKEVDKSHEN